MVRSTSNGTAIVAMMGEPNATGWTRFCSMCPFTSAAIALWRALRFFCVNAVGTYEAISMLGSVSARLYVPTDQRRFLELVANVPGVDIVRGPLAGARKVAEVRRAPTDGTHLHAGELPMGVTAGIGVAASSGMAPAVKGRQTHAVDATYTATQSAHRRVSTLDIA